MRIGWQEGWDPQARMRGVVAFSGFVDAFDAERDRWILWCPVFLGIGVALYFQLLSEPPAWIGPAAVCAMAAVLVLCRRTAFGVVIGLVLLLAAVGFWRAQVQTQLVAAPVIEKRMGPVTVVGRIARIETMTQGHRLLFDTISVSRLSRDRTPARLRVRSMRPVAGLAPGQVVTMRAVLMPPPGPAAPGAFDFGRQLYFHRIGAVGFAVGNVHVSDAADGALETGVARIRHAATQRILTSLDPPAGAVAAALMTGERGAIPEEVLTAMRDAGLAHLLAISGLHMGLVAGLLFFTVRLALAMSPPIALRFQIKKWAAVVAIIGAFGYLLISGATIPTQRAFAMTLVVLLAVLFDRNAISMRLVAWAAAIVLLIAPESLMSASFQLSFAAVVALVAFYEALRSRLSSWRHGTHVSRRVALYLVTISLTTVIAGLATAPFAMMSFNRLATYGVVANILAVPLTGFWIMPWAIVAFLLMPFGLEGVALVPMGWGIDAVIAIATTVAGWPGSVRLVPAPPDMMVVLVAAGGLWLCLWRRRWRYAGAVVALGGIALIGLARPPDVLVDGDSGLMAVRMADGRYAMSSTRKTFQGDIWQRRAGTAEPVAWPGAGRTGTDRLRCDPLGCLHKTGGWIVVLARHRAALLEDCMPGAIVISLVPVWRRHCRGPIRLIRPYDLWRNGPHAIWLEPDGSRIRHVRSASGVRPWTAAGRREAGRGRD